MPTPVKFPAFDLSTPEGRRAAQHDLIWTDHGFLRNLYQNFHWIEPGVMARSNQPSPEQIAGYAALALENRSFILFKHKDHKHLVQCSVRYDVTRKPSVITNCYELR